MNDNSHPVLSNRQLLISLVLSMLIGVVLTIFFILPAETAYDPSGVGKAMSLDKLSVNKSPEQKEVVTVTVSLPVDALYVSLDPETTTPSKDAFGDSLPVMDGTNLRAHNGVYKTETLEIPIGLDAQVEYKAIMDSGEVLLYSWEADGELYYDFHAHQVEGNPDFWTRYSEGEARKDQGSIVAPYHGQHGWYWLNISDKPVTVKLTVTGYYDKIIEVDLNSEKE